MLDESGAVAENSSGGGVTDYVEADGSVGYGESYGSGASGIDSKGDTVVAAD